MASEVSKASIISMRLRSLKFPIPLDKVLEISKTLRPNSIGNFKDLMAQWYRKFQRLYGPMVLEISKTLRPNGIGNFKDLMAQCKGIGNFKDLMAQCKGIGNFKDLMAKCDLAIRSFEISDTFG